MTVRKRGSKFIVVDSSGKKLLGTHTTRAAANRQLRAVEASKTKEKKKGKK